MVGGLSSLWIFNYRSSAWLMWRNATQALVDQAHDQITKLLTSEWLVSDVEDDGGELNKCTRLAFNELTVFSR